jgi:hypothetical protein
VPQLANLSVPGWKTLHRRRIFTGMESGPSDLAILRWFAAIGTIVTALSMGYIAHYEFGFSRQEIRTPAGVGAAVIGLLVATDYFGKKLRKPK